MLEKRMKDLTGSGVLLTVPHVVRALHGKINGVASLFCGDCERAAVDLLPYHEAEIVAPVCGRNSHLLALNGGALLLSPLLKDRYFQTRRKVLLKDLEFALGKKNLNLVAGYIHLPCGVAEHSKIGADSSLDHLRAAEALVWDTLQIPMLGLIHSDLRNHGKGKGFKTHCPASSLEQVMRRLKAI